MFPAFPCESWLNIFLSTAWIRRSQSLMRVYSCSFVVADSNQIPRLARHPAQKPRGFGVADDFFFRGLPSDFSACPQCNVSEMGDDGGAVSGLHVRYRALPSADAFDEILHVQSCGVISGHFLSFHSSTL